MEFIVWHPQATYDTVRNSLGERIDFLPSKLPLLVASALNIPAIQAGRLQERFPIVGLLKLSTSEPVKLALAMRLASGRELVAALTTGNHAQFNAARTREGVTRLLESSGQNSDGLSMAVYADSLLLGMDPGFIEQSARFLHHRALEADRELAQNKPTGQLRAVLNREIFASVLPAILTQTWRDKKRELELADKKAREARGGRTPDFAEPAAVLVAASAMVERAATLLESLEEAVIDVTLTESSGYSELSLDVKPLAGGAAEAYLASLRHGPLTPLAELPAMTRFAWLGKRAEGSDKPAAESGSTLFSELLGERLKQDDRELLQRTIEGLATGLGEDVTVGILGPDAQRGVGGFIRGFGGDAEAFDTAASRLPDLLDVQAVAQPLTQFVGRPRVRRSRVTLAAERPGQLASVDFRSPDGKLTMQLELLSTAQGANVLSVLAPQATPLMNELLAPTRRLSSLAPKLWQRAPQRVAKAAFFDVRAAEPGAHAPVLVTLSAAERKSPGGPSRRGHIALYASQDAVLHALESVQ